MADSTDSGLEVMEKQDVAEEENHVMENESHEIMSETGSSNIVEGGADDSSTLLHFKDSDEIGSRLHTVPRFQTSILTTDSMLDKSALLAQRSSTPNHCHQQETDASSLQEVASGDHNHSSNVADEKLLVPQSGISYADKNGYLDKLYGTDALTIEEYGKENSEDFVRKTSLPDHPLSGKKKQSDISVVNLNRIIKLAERRKKELFKSHMDDLISLKGSSNKGDLDDSSGITTGGSQSQDCFRGQPHKDEFKTEEDNKDSAFESECKTHGRPKSHFCISCEVYTCFQCLYTHIGHDVKHKDDIANSIMEELKFMSDCIASSQNLVKLHTRTAVKQQFLALKQNTDGCLKKFEEFKCAQIAQLCQEESRLQDEIADMHRTKKQIWKQKKQLLKNVEKDLQVMIAKAKLNGNSGNRQNLQQKLQYLKRGQQILDKLPSLYCQVLSHEVDPEPVDIQMDPILNKWKFVKSAVFKPKLDESLTGCAAVSKQVKFEATEGCDIYGTKNDNKVRYQTVSSMTEFENWSFEEIRWSHYVSKKIVSSSQQNKLMQDPLFDFGTSFVDLNSAKSTATSTRFSKSKTPSTSASLSGKTKTLSAKTAVFKTSNQATPTTSSSGTYSFGSRKSAFEKQKTSLDPTKSVPYSGKFSFDNLLAKFEQPKTSSDEDQAQSTITSTSKPFSFGTFAQPKISSVDPTKTTSYSGKVSYGSSLPTFGKLKMPCTDKATPISTSGTFSFGSSLGTIEQPKASYLDPIKPTPYSGTATVGSSSSAFGQAQTLSTDQPIPTTTSGTVSFGSGLSAFEQPKTSSEQPKISFLNQATSATSSSGSFSFGAFEQSKPSSLDQTKLIQSSGTVASGSLLSTFRQLKTSVTDHVMPTKTSSSTSRFGSRFSTFEQPKTSSSDQAMPTTTSTSGTSSFRFPLSTFGQPKPSSSNQSTATTSSSGMFSFGAVEQPKTCLEPTKPIASSGKFSFLWY